MQIAAPAPAPAAAPKPAAAAPKPAAPAPAPAVNQTIDQVPVFFSLWLQRQTLFGTRNSSSNFSRPR